MNRKFTHGPAHKECLESVRSADARHEVMLARVAKRGGKTVNQVRSMGMKEKDAFIFAHRDRLWSVSNG